jgi:DNA repair protein RecN (Recombination protein N)
VIRDLSISNLGVIADARLEFDEGLTVLTGETGAGKTLITTALSLLLGAKGDPVLVRHGASEAVIDCTVAVDDDSMRSRLAEFGATMDDGELIITRTVGARSRCIVGSRPVAAAVLADLLGERVTVHGQHGQVRLTRAADQRMLLDASDPEIAELLPVVRQAWTNLRDAAAALADAETASDQDEQVLSGHRALVDDVATVSPAEGEDVLLDTRIATLSALEAIERSTRTSAAMLVDGDSIEITDVSTLLAQMRRLLEPHAEVGEFAGWLVELAEVQERVSSLAHDITGFIDSLEGDDSSLDQVLSRRAQIGALMRRWNCDLETLLARTDAAARALALAADPQERLRELQALVGHCREELERVCERIHVLRMAAGARLATRVQAELRELGVPHAEFDVRVVRQGNATAHGDDGVEFLFTANPGQPPQALASVGSGGELSRVMLALETVAEVARARTFVFDEVDAGLGGRAALEVGRRLAELARENQVIVVTHLAQVAAFADRHIVVEKTVEEGNTLTTARTLAASERPKELTRLLSGVEDSASAMAHAEELLDLAIATRGGVA